MLIQSRRQFEQLLAHLESQDIVVADVESNGLSVADGHQPIAIAFYFPAEDASFYFPFAHGVGIVERETDYTVDDPEFHAMSWQGREKVQIWKAHWFQRYLAENPYENMPREWLSELIERWGYSDVLYIFYNAQFDIHMMHSVGFPIPQRIEDIRSAVSIVFEDWGHWSINGNNTLKWQAAQWGVDGALDGEDAFWEGVANRNRVVAAYIGMNWDDPANASYQKSRKFPGEDAIAKRLKISGKSELWMLPPSSVSEYAEQDVIITWGLRQKLYPLLTAWDNIRLFEEKNEAQIRLALRMEQNGMLLRVEEAKRLIDLLDSDRDEAERWFKDVVDAHPQWQDFYDADGVNTFNPGSPVKLLKFLNRMGINVTGTDKDTLKRWSEDHAEEPDAIRYMNQYRTSIKLANTYLRKWLKAVDADGYIHGGFNINGTETGRWSSSSGVLGNTGNFQNAPASRKAPVKNAIGVPDGWIMIQADYKQLELRLGAWIADCTKMIEMIEENVDMHAYTRDEIDVRGILFYGLTAEEALAHAHLTAGGKDPEDVLNNHCRQVAKTLNFGLLYSGSWRMVDRLLHVGEGAARRLHHEWNALYPEFQEANAQWERQALTRRPRPDGTRFVQYVTQPISNRHRKYGMYPAAYKTKEGGTMNVQESEARGAFNFAVQGLGGYIMERSGTEICRRFSNDILRPFATIHDSFNAYVRRDSLHILPEIERIMTGWPQIRPSLGVDFQYSLVSWGTLSDIKNLDQWIKENRQ